MSKLATVLTYTSRVFVSVRHPVSARHLSFTFQRVPPQTPVTLRSADCGSWRPNRDPRISDPCLYFYYLVFVLYCLFLVWLSSQERNGLTTGSCSPAYGGECFAKSLDQVQSDLNVLLLKKKKGGNAAPAAEMVELPRVSYT